MASDGNENCVLALTIRGREIRVDESGLLSLADIWRASGHTKRKKPREWLDLATTRERIAKAYPIVTGHRGPYPIADQRAVLRLRSGTDLSPFAHPLVAIDYAAFLSPGLAVEINATYLRVKSGDAILADEILAKANEDANRWAGTRAMSRATRLKFTGTLKAHGVGGYGYADCTDAVYQKLFDGTAKTLKKNRGLAKNDNLRDVLSEAELSFLMAAEALGAERIEEETCDGNIECRVASAASAQAIRNAIDQDRTSRRKRLL
jgi:KilA-N domain